MSLLSQIVNEVKPAKRLLAFGLQLAKMLEMFCTVMAEKEALGGSIPHLEKEKVSAET